MRMHILLAALLLTTTSALADIVHLKDGTAQSGDIKKAADGWYVTANGKTTLVPAEQVKSIELAPRGDPKAVAAGRLASLRRSVEAVGDIKEIIDRYTRFLSQNKGTPAEADAAKDLATWKDRLEKKMVRVGNQWVLPQEKAELQSKTLLVVDRARQLLKQNKLHEADEILTKALEVDPKNPSAQYLKGLILYRQDQVPAARKAFETVKEAMPDDGPTLNNLAIVQWRQNQQVAAVGTYLAAMQAMPLNKQLLNNVAEALNSLTDDQRKSTIVQKAIRVWTEQDNQLQQQMMPLGWYRWGSTWVDKAQYDTLQAAEKEVKDKIAKMEADFADAQAKIDTIDAQMKQNRDAMRYMEANRTAYDNQGKPVGFYPLPPQYWDYDRANRRLDTQEKETVALLNALRAKAQLVKQQLPVPKFRGIQVMIGVEGTPAAAPANGAAAIPAAPPPAPAKEKPSAVAVKPETAPPAAKNPLESNPKPPADPKLPKGDKPLKY